jgi:glycosyltransferase involved in cell wall biosynthesis
VPVPTVLMCARNAASTLDVQLAALEAQDLSGPWRLVAVENASTDATLAVLDRWAARIPHMVVLNEPVRGPCRARNRGLREIPDGIVAMCDADDAVSPSWLRELVAALERYDVVGGALDPVALNRLDAPRQGVVQRTALPTVFGWHWVVGANLGFHKRVADAVGEFDSTFDGGSDDTDFALRAQLAGFTVGFAPEAVVSYRVRSTAWAVVEQRFRYGRGHQRLVDKYARLGHIESTHAQRWKVIAAQSAEILAHLPDAAHRNERMQYLASVAYLGGRVAELVAELPLGRGRTREVARASA